MVLGSCLEQEHTTIPIDQVLSRYNSNKSSSLWILQFQHLQGACKIGTATWPYGTQHTTIPIDQVLSGYNVWQILCMATPKAPIGHNIQFHKSWLLTSIMAPPNYWVHQNCFNMSFQKRKTNLARKLGTVITVHLRLIHQANGLTNIMLYGTTERKWEY